MKSSAPTRRAATALLVGGVELAITDIVEDGGGEEVGFLEDDAHALAQQGLGDVGDGDAVVEDDTALDIVEAVDEVDDGGLAGSGTADKGDLLSGTGVDIDVEEDLLLGGVAEINMLEVDIALKN